MGVTALSGLEVPHSHQTDKDLTLELYPPVTSPLAQLDPTPWALLVHQEAPALAPLPGLETLPSAPEVHSLASALDTQHLEAVSDQPVHLEALASACRDTELEAPDPVWEEPLEAAVPL